MRKLKVDLSRYHRWFIRWSERNITEEDCLNGEIENLYVMAKRLAEFNGNTH